MTKLLGKGNAMNCASDRSGRTIRCLKIALAAIVGVAALGWVVMLLWNWLMPALFFGAQPVGYGQALAILLLARILFGGFRGRCHGGWASRGEAGSGMNAQEREQLKGRFAGHRWGCGSGTERDESPNDTVAGAK
jgi:hypothetical protein